MIKKKSHILETCNLKVGFSTSPHLNHMNSSWKADISSTTFRYWKALPDEMLHMGPSGFCTCKRI